MKAMYLYTEGGSNGDPHPGNNGPVLLKGKSGRGNKPAGPARERDRLLSILSRLPDAVMVINRLSDITYMNSRARELFGDNLERKCHEGLKGGRRACKRCPVTRAFKSGASQHDAVEVVLLNGYVRHLETDVIPLGGTDEAVFVARDITSQKAAECRRRDMLSMISHDMRTQLSIVAINAEFFRQSGTEDADGQRADAVEALRKAARNTSRLMDDFTLLSRMESGRLNLDPQPLPLSMLLSYTLSSIGRLSDGSSANIHTEVPEDLPEVMVDVDQFGRIFTNIITNALKHGHGGVNIRIGANAEGEAEMVRLEIADDGPGIPAKDLPYVFDRYYGGSRGKKTTGHGLGLAIVKKITEMHGGDVEIKSKEGEGTTVVIRLPIAPSTH